jgi:type I restriction enzyme, S subunit
VLAGHIIFAFQSGGYIGRTKLQKMLFLCERHSKLDFDTHYVKETAGPLDQKFLYSFLDEAKTKNWIEETSINDGYKYKPADSISELTKDYPKYFRADSDKITFVIKLIRNMNTETSELTATIYAIWSNYIIQNKHITDQLLISEVYDWDPRKTKFDRDIILSTWQRMKEDGLAPVGFGKLIGKSA